MRLLHAAAALALLAASSLAGASTIYTYTGQHYTSATLPYNTTESVTGSFTLASALAANLANGTVTPTSFSFSDGVQTITDTTALSYSFGSLSTDANGNLTNYFIQINTATQGFIKLSAAGGGVSGDSVRLSVGNSGSNTVAGMFQTSGGTAAVTPEPGTFLLLGTGLLAIGARFRRFV